MFALSLSIFYETVCYRLSLLFPPHDPPPWPLAREGAIPLPWPTAKVGGIPLPVRGGDYIRGWYSSLSFSYTLSHLYFWRLLTFLMDCYVFFFPRPYAPLSLLSLRIIWRGVSSAGGGVIKMAVSKPTF